MPNFKGWGRGPELDSEADWGTVPLLYACMRKVHIIITYLASLVAITAPVIYTQFESADVCL